MPRIGALKKARILMAALLVAILTSLWLLLYPLDNWLRSKTAETLEFFVHCAVLVVLLGVIIEEWEIIEGGAKFARFIWHGRFRDAVRKMLEKEHKKKLIEGAGFAILVLGLTAELQLGPIIDARHKEELLAQGPREALLRGAIRKTIVDSLKPFSGQNIDIRFSAARSWGAGGNFETVAIGDDVLGLSQTFVGILKDANWNFPGKPLVSELRGRGLRVEVVQNASLGTTESASALVDALRKVPLTMVEGPVSVKIEQAKRVPTDKALPEFGKDTIILTVLTHP
jgi:hypothetical protein